MSKKINFKITKNEHEILDALWREDKPLTRSGILEAIKDDNFNVNSFYRFLNGLLKKGIIKEGEIVRSGKTYGRTYIPNITKEEYDLHQLETLNEIVNPSKKTGMSFILNMINSYDFTKDNIEELEEIIKKKKDEIKWLQFILYSQVY